MTYTTECGGTERPVRTKKCAGKGNESIVRQIAHGIMAILALSFGMSVARADPAAADPQPTAAMLEAVHGLVAFMSAPSDADPPRVFASRGLCIVENFAPYVFCGPNAAKEWASAYRAHLDGETGLVATFGPAHDFSESADRAYFSLPTTWTGLMNGKHFKELGAWAFVLKRDGTAWRVLGYGWGVTSRVEIPPP